MIGDEGNAETKRVKAIEPSGMELRAGFARRVSASGGGEACAGVRARRNGDG